MGKGKERPKKTAHEWSVEDYLKHLEKNGASDKPNKYRNAPVRVDGILFASKHEARRWRELLAMQAAGYIKELRRQVAFTLSVNDIRITSYRCDFQYIEAASGERVIEDAKSDMTKRIEAYRIKRRLMKAVLGIDVKEV
jgi:hypothetical protein